MATHFGALAIVSLRLRITFVQKLVSGLTSVLLLAQVPSVVQAQSMSQFEGTPEPPVMGPQMPSTVAEGAGELAGDYSLVLGEDAQELASAIAQAARTYPTVAAARASERAARAGLSGAQWQRYPGVSVEVLGTAAGGAPGNSGSDFAFNVEQPLWSGGRIDGTIKMSRAQLTASQLAISEAQLDIALRVNAAYFDFQRLIQREIILEENLREHQNLVDSMSRRVANELSPNSDLELARSRSAQVAQDLALTVGQRRIALTRLRELTGDPVFNVTTVLSYDPDIHHPDGEGLLDQVLAFDPKRRRLQAEILVADADVQVRRSAIFPQVNAQYQRPTSGPDRLGVVLRAQTEGGLSRLSAVSAARERRAGAEIAILANERELREQVEADLLENSVARDRAASSSLSATSAAAVTASFMRQFVAGRRTWYDVMNALRESTVSRLSEVDARVSAMASAARLLLRSGRWAPQAQGEQGQ